MSQAPGLSGTPVSGHRSSAATSASWARSSARPTSRTIRASPAMSLADSILQTASIARWVSEAVKASVRISGRTRAVHHPGHAEPIDRAAVAQGPEGLLDRHLHLAVFGQGLEDTLRFRRVVDLHRHVGTLDSLVRVLRRAVRAHQCIIAYLQMGVHDPVVCQGRHVFARGRLPERNHGLDLACEGLLIELERGLAIAIEFEVGVQLHAMRLLVCAPTTSSRSPSRENDPPPRWDRSPRARTSGAPRSRRPSGRDWENAWPIPSPLPSTSPR